MKKSLIILVLFGLVVLPVWAQTTSITTSTNQSVVDTLKVLIEQLQAQIKELQIKVQNLITTRQQVRNSIGEIRDTLQEIKDLRKGMTSEEIKAIQQILAADPSIYPEGLITGYFGPATERALERFRERYRIREEEKEKIGEKTLQKIRELLQERQEIKLENGQKCVIVPPGHLIAPGFLKKTTSTTSTVSIPECQLLPKGIEKLLRIGLPVLEKNSTSTSTSTQTSISNSTTSNSTLVENQTSTNQ